MQLLTPADIDRLQHRYSNPTFAAAVAKLRTTADRQMQQPLHVPDEGAGWIHDYTCPDHATRLTYDPNKPREHVCAVDGAVFSGGVYDEAWRAFKNNQLIRSAHAAALLWLMAGEQAYFDHAATILREYAQRYAQFPVHGTHAGQGKVMGQSLTEATWSIPTAWTFDILRDALPEADRELIHHELLVGLGDHLLTQLWERIHNIQCWHLAGLATIGVVLDDEQYLQPTFHPAWGFAAQVREGVLEDGWWWEGSPHYHFYTTQAMTSLAMAVRYQHPELLDNPRFQRMFAAPLDLLRPDLSLPALNDGWFDTSPPGGVAQYVQVFERVHGFWREPIHSQMLANIYDRYAERSSADALLFGPDDLPARAAATPKRVVQAASGYAILQSRDNSRHLLLKYGPHGGGHGHPDKLGLELWGHGERLSPDLGTPGYGIPLNRSWYRQTIAHNTLLIDESEQPHGTGRLRQFEIVNDELAVVDTEINWSDTYLNMYHDVRLRRIILWHEDYFIDLMSVVCPRERQLDLAWHHTGILDLAGWQPSDIEFEATGYEHLTTIQQIQADEWQAIWRTPSGPGSQLWALNPPETQTFSAAAPYNPASETMSLMMRRTHAKSALFASVVESFAEAPRIQQVQWTTTSEELVIEIDGQQRSTTWKIRLDAAEPMFLTGESAGRTIYDCRM